MDHCNCTGVLELSEGGSLGSVLEEKAVNHAGVSAPVKTLERASYTFSRAYRRHLLSCSIAEVAPGMKEVIPGMQDQFNSSGAPA